MYLQKVISRKVLFKLFFCWGLEGQCRKNCRTGSISQRHGYADPDPHQDVMDAEH
jgi:hypothetical protein